jgi:hypothetical protein
MTISEKYVFRLLGICLFAQALTHLLGGLVGICGMEKLETAAFMNAVAANVGDIYCGISLQIVSCVLIIVLCAALYETVRHTNTTIAKAAMCLYVFGAILYAVSQIFVFALADVSQKFAESGSVSATLAGIGGVLLVCWDSTMKIAVIPYGVGALIFYALLMRMKVIPKWLAAWGLATIPLLLVGELIAALGITLPPALVWLPVLYAPWEFVAGIYVFIKSSSRVKSGSVVV